MKVRHGVEFRAIRHRIGMSQAELASVLGTAQAEVCKIESGKRQIPRGRLREWEEALAEHGVSPGELTSAYVSDVTRTHVFVGVAHTSSAAERSPLREALIRAGWKPPSPVSGLG